MIDDDRLITEAHILDLAARPGTVLVLQADDDAPHGYLAQVVTPAEMTPGQAPVWRSAWSEPDADGLSAKHREYLTHNLVAAAAEPDRPAWADQLADHWLSAAFISWERRGGEPLVDELADDPTAWTRYTI